MATSSTPSSSAPYRVELHGCPGLPADQRAAAELRFRMALEAALGGPAYVLPSLQGYMLAQSLQDMGADDDGVPDSAGGPDEADRDDDHDHDHDDSDDAMDQLVALWETAEAQAIMAAMKPLGDALPEAHFQIVPV